MQRLGRPRWRAAARAVGPLALACFASLGCSKEPAPPGGAPSSSAPAPLGASGCGHAACGPNYFVDAAQSGDCAQGANCAMTLTLVATGDFHINDQYPYKFHADEASGFKFLGADAAGPNVFSKAANDWQRTGPQTGTMTVGFQSARKGKASLSGLFKLSVCSAQNCQLEQQTVTAAVAIR